VRVHEGNLESPENQAGEVTSLLPVSA
jgi:hypothetical protein